MHMGLEYVNQPLLFTECILYGQIFGDEKCGLENSWKVSKSSDLGVFQINNLFK